MEKELLEKTPEVVESLQGVENATPAIASKAKMGLIVTGSLLVVGALGYGIVKLISRKRKKATEVATNVETTEEE